MAVFNYGFSFSFSTLSFFFSSIFIFFPFKSLETEIFSPAQSNSLYQLAWCYTINEIQAIFGLWDILRFVVFWI